VYFYQLIFTLVMMVHCLPLTDYKNICFNGQVIVYFIGGAYLCKCIIRLFIMVIRVN